MASRVSDPRGIADWDRKHDTVLIRSDLRQVKPKNVVGRQNRKALGDIGNLVNVPTGKRGRQRLLSSALTKTRNLANHMLPKEEVPPRLSQQPLELEASIEEEGGIRDYMGSQPEINVKMRFILIDWLVDVHRKFELMPETLYLNINFIDRFLSLTTVPRRELQLLGISAMLIACKYEEIWAPEVNDLVSISDNAYCIEEVLAMEKSILRQVEWCITIPTPYVFLARYIKASVPCDIEMEKLVFYLAELGLMQYPVAVLNRPSMLAASAVYAARQTLKKTPCWTETLKHHTGYSEDEIM